MLSTALRSWLIAGWLATLTGIVAVSVAVGANLSTTSWLLALGLAPGIVMVLLGRGAASPTVAEILHAVDSNTGRGR